MQWCKLSSVWALAILLTACAGQSRQDPPPQNWLEHSSRLNALEHWKMQGKIAFRSVNGAESASISWLQQNQRTQVRLSGPLGFSATTISSDGEAIEIKQAEGVRHYAMSDADRIYAETGIELPIKALPHWLKGVPDPAAKIDQQELLEGQLKQLVQSGWTISYTQYKPFDRYLLPTKVTMNRADTKVRLIMRHWKTENLE